MNSRSDLFAITLVIFSFTLLALLLRGWLEVRRRSRIENLGAILKRLVITDREVLSAIALDDRFNDEDESEQLDPTSIWDARGGLEGIAILGKNCDVLIDLAYYVQRRYPDAVVVAEQLRLSTREVKWHISRLEAADRRGTLMTVFPDYARRPIVIYHNMTEMVLELYARGDVPGYSTLLQKL